MLILTILFQSNNHMYLSNGPEVSRLHLLLERLAAGPPAEAHSRFRK